MDKVQRDIRQITALEKDHKSILVTLRAYWINNFYSLSEIDKRILTNEINYYRAYWINNLYSLSEIDKRILINEINYYRNYLGIKAYT